MAKKTLAKRVIISLLKDIEGKEKGNCLHSPKTSAIRILVSFDSLYFFTVCLMYF